MRNTRRFFFAGKPLTMLGLCAFISLSMTAPATADSWFSSFLGSKKKNAEQEAPIFVPQETRSDKRKAPTTWHGQQAVPDTTKALTEQKSQTLRQMSHGNNSGSYAEQLQAMTRQGYDPLNLSFVGPQAKTAQDIKTTALAHSASKLERARTIKEGTALSASNRSVNVQNTQDNQYTPRNIPTEADFVPLMAKQARHHESTVTTRSTATSRSALPNQKLDTRSR